MTSRADLPAPAVGGAVAGLPDLTRLRRRTVAVLATAQVLGGLAAGAVVSVGSPLAYELSGQEAWSGVMTTASTLGAAMASLGLARLAVARGRRRALSTGLALAAAGAAGIVLATVLASFPLLVTGAVLIGVGSAVNLQSRFAATDLSTPASRPRDLSLVVWASTVGAVVGPNLVGLDEWLSRISGLPSSAGVFVFAGVGMLAALVVVQVGLRPDPLDVAGRADGATGGREQVPVRVAAATLRRHPPAAGAVVGVVTAHAVMVAVMAMTPLHMTGHGASSPLIGLTVSVHLAAMFALSPLMGMLASVAGPRRVLVAGLGVVVVGAAVCGAAGGAHALVTVGLTLVGAGWSAATVAGSSILAGEVPGAERVAIQGLSDALMLFAGAGGGLLAGVGLGLIGFAGIGVTSAAVALGGAVAVLVVSRRRDTAARRV
ncbi:MFS transporter [Cellulomonas sp.]|uniref:MFS transporter n=1 Tax=Cellulomonas sp. TaxID=40001 RepID=UPI0025C52C76|nr:MFS transporter [Cellulomonas sp.]